MQHQLGNDGLTRWKERVLAHAKKRGMHYTVHHNRSGCIFSLSLPKEKPILLDKKRSTSPGPSSTSLSPTHWFIFLPPPPLRFPCDSRAKKKKKIMVFWRTAEREPASPKTCCFCSPIWWDVMASLCAVDQTSAVPRVLPEQMD